MKQGKIEQYKDSVWLRQEYCVNKLSLEKVGELCGVSYSCIWKWLKKNGIKRRGRSEHLKGKPAWNSGLTNKVDKRILAGATHAMWGRTHSEKSKELARHSWKLWCLKNPTYHKGENNPFYGKKHSKESIQKNREANSMENNANWQGGISFEPYGIEFNDELKRQIRERNNFTCQMPGCGIKENGRAHDVHHIDYDKTNNNDFNLITLCHRCHLKTNYNRDYWMAFLGDINND